MKVILKLEESNFKNNIPSSFGAEVTGGKVLTIKSKWDSQEKILQLDVHNFHFDENSILLEGPISTERELLGRCVLRVTDVGVLAKGRSK